jgi:catechol 2,3-dioxygenase-like lactoylglutathione lyase family enzyme
MSAPVFAPSLCQVAWVVRDINASEDFFKKVMGVEKFLQFRNIKARDTKGTYMGQPADWVIHVSLAYAGDTQIELIQHVSGSSVHQEWIEQHGDGVQHVAYWLDDADYEAAVAHMTGAGFPLVQSFTLPMARIAYFDTRPVIGVVTEIFAATAVGYQFRDNMKTGNF